MDPESSQAVEEQRRKVVRLFWVMVAVTVAFYGAGLFFAEPTEAEVPWFLGVALVALALAALLTMRVVPGVLMRGRSSEQATLIGGQKVKPAPPQGVLLAISLISMATAEAIGLLAGVYQFVVGTNFVSPVILVVSGIAFYEAYPSVEHWRVTAERIEAQTSAMTDAVSDG